MVWSMVPQGQFDSMAGNLAPLSTPQVPGKLPGIFNPPMPTGREWVGDFGASYKPGFVGGQRFPTWNVTPGNRVFDIPSMTPYSQIPWGNQPPYYGAPEFKANPELAQETAIPNRVVPFGTLGQLGLLSADMFSKPSDFMRRGGTVGRDQLNRARIRSLMRLRKRRRRR